MRSVLGIYAHSDLRRVDEERLRAERAKTAKVRKLHLQLSRLFEEHSSKRPNELRKKLYH